MLHRDTDKLDSEGREVERCIYRVQRDIDYTANASKLIEKYFPDFRNMLSNQENIGIFSENKENKLTEINTFKVVDSCLNFCKVPL